MKKVWIIYEGGDVAAYANTEEDAKELVRMYRKYDQMLSPKYALGGQTELPDPKVAVLSPETGIMFHVGLDDNGKIINVFVVTDFLIQSENITADKVMPWPGGENSMHVCVYAKSQNGAIKKAKALFKNYKTL